MKTTKKPCTHSQTRMQSRVGRRVLALCCACRRLTVVRKAAK